MSGTETNPLKMDFSGQKKWWKELVEYYHGWYYLTEPSATLLTTYYAQLLVDGTVPASKENIMAAQRHLNDLERSKNDPDYPWVFDEEKAWRPIRFIEENTRPSKGTIKRLVLQPWQHFVLGNIFGWVDKETGLRRFNEGLIFVGRKNGKTTIQSGLAIYMAGFDGENGAEVYALANMKAQAGRLVDETIAMIDASEFLKKRFKTTKSMHKVEHQRTHSTILSLSAEKHSKDGFNTSFAVFDEIHEYKDYELIEVMRRSMGQRMQPLTVYISTAGTVLDGPMTDFFRSGKETLEQYDENLNERSFYYLAKIDDVKEADNPEMWIKANPNLPMMDGLSLLSNYKKDMRTPQQRRDWITKQFNLFSESGEQSLLDAETILANNDEIDESELAGIHPVAGFDLSDTEDFTAAALEFPLPDGRVFIKQHTWIPQARYDREEQYKERFNEWIEADEMTVLPGEHVDHGAVYDWLVDMDNKYDFIQINYDYAKAITLNTMLENHGFHTQRTVQGFTTLGGPLQNFKELMLDHKVVFNNSRLFKWYLSNVALVTDRNNNWMPTKTSRYRKIDGFAAALNCHVTIAPMLVSNINNSEPNLTYMSFEELMNLDA